RRPQGDRARADGKRRHPRQFRASIFRHHGSVGWRKGGGLGATGDWTARSRCLADGKLRLAKAAALLGSAAGRSALRSNCSTVRANCIEIELPQRPTLKNAPRGAVVAVPAPKGRRRKFEISEMSAFKILRRG